MRRKLDLLGERYGSLLVIKDMGKNKFKQSLWMCECSCGNKITIPLCRLRSSNIKSCGRCKPNVYQVKDNYVICTVGDGRSFIFDVTDLKKVSEKTWYISAQGYVSSDTRQKGIKLHNLILPPAENEIVDHINRNKLNNQRENLRKCTKQKNCFNQGIRCTNTSGYKGVTFDKRRKTYTARITYNGRTYYLGTFKEEDILDAAKAYNQKAIELFGEYAFLNAI